MSEVEILDKEEDRSSSVPMRRDYGHFLMSVPMELVGKRFEQLQEFLKKHLREGRDYGKVPGVDKPFLFKAGAENLCLVFSLRPEYEVIPNHNFSISPPYFSYDVKCRLYNQETGALRGEGVGHCNSWESKYRYRNKKKICPVCGLETINRSKYPPKGKPNEEPGWYCYAKQGGCGAGFVFIDTRIINQATGRVANEDVSDLQNTILKMAKKRSFEDATLTTTGASGLLTQDPEAVGMSEENFTDSEEKRSPSPAPSGTPTITEEPNKSQAGEGLPPEKGMKGTRFATPEEWWEFREMIKAPCFSQQDVDALEAWLPVRKTDGEFSEKRIQLQMAVSNWKKGIFEQL